MADIDATDVSATIVKQMQIYGPVNEFGEHIRWVTVDLTIDTTDNKAQGAAGIPLDNLFDSTNASYINIKPDKIWMFQAEFMLEDGDTPTPHGEQYAVNLVRGGSGTTTDLGILVNTTDAPAGAGWAGTYDGTVTDNVAMTLRCTFVGEAVSL